VLLYGGALSPTDLPIAHELARLGYVDGRNITYAVRAAEGDASRLPKLARELVADKPDVIVAVGSSAAIALVNATRDIPVVMTLVGDPIALGLTDSISKPSQNVTGFTVSSLSLAAKRLEILHDIVPSLHKAGYFWVPENPLARSFKVHAQQAADTLGITLVWLPVASYVDFDDAFARAEREQVQALLIEASELTRRLSSRIVDHCLFYNLPCLHTWPIAVRNGALISYGPNTVENFSGAAAYVDRIFKGANIAELPFVEPTEIKLTVNLSTARTLRVAIPPALLIRADEVVE